VPRAKAQALGKAGYVPRAMALALGTEGLTGGPDRLCAESLLAQLSAQEPPAGPLVSSVPRADQQALGTEVGPTSVSGRLTPRLCREPPTGSRQRALLCRELSPRLSAQKWGPQFTPSVVDGPVTRAKWALGTAVPRVWAVAPGRAACAGPAVPGALCRELPLGTGYAESKQPCAEWVRLSAEAPIPVVSSICTSCFSSLIHALQSFLHTLS
jgi:hypothetical protein